MILKRVLFSFLSLLISLSCVCGTAYADSPYTYVSVSYSSGLEISDNDMFTLVYEVKGQTGDAKIDVSPSLLKGKMGLVNLPAANYLITKITYSGDNENINQQGYACTSSFSTSSKGGVNIEIAAGKEAVQKLTKSHPDAITVAGQKSEDDTEADTNSSSDTADQKADTSDKTQNSDTEKTNTAGSKKETSGKNASNDSDEKYTKTSDIAKTAATSMLTLIPLVFVLVIGLAVMFILHKSGKL